MKKLILTLSFLFFGATTSFANLYPDYLYDNPNYPMVYGHMDVGFYIDKKSITLLQNNRQGTIFSENLLYVQCKFNSSEMKEVPQKITKSINYYFYYPTNPTQLGCVHSSLNNIILPPYLGPDLAYYSKDQGSSWTPFYISNESGYNQPTRNDFLFGFEVATGNKFTPFTR